jgi:aspartyl aminopeptidase
MIAGHVDALTARLKPVSSKTTKAGYVQLGVAPYAGALNSTWWDRDLGIGGRVLVKDGKTGKIETKLVKLGWPSMYHHNPLTTAILIYPLQLLAFLPSHHISVSE